MYFMALATDYDGTLAEDGRVSNETLAALERLRDTGRRLVMVTGRELPDLKEIFPELGIFDKVVAENGALLYTPASEEERTIAPPPPPEFVEALRARGVDPLSVGRSIVATWEPHQNAVLETIREFGLELDIIFNKGAVMILPSGINKAAGLEAALDDLGLSPHNVVGIGDAENDHAFLRLVGCGAAVANALPAVKDTADLVTGGARGKGVQELIDRLIDCDHAVGITARYGIAVGRDRHDNCVELRPTDCVLIAGSSGIGKSTLATAFSERFVEKGFQFCVFDPEGDYEELEDSVSIGDGKTEPSIEQAMKLLDNPKNNIVLSTLALQLKERPEFFADILPKLGQLRARTARPHWLIVDEVHHLLPKRRGDAPLVLPLELPGSILITVHPDAVATEILKLVTAVIALGPQADEVIAIFCRETGAKPPKELTPPDDQHVIFWRPAAKQPPLFVAADGPRQSRKRHTRKYAEGQLSEEESFYFRGPDDALNLRAQNLMMFLQIAEGVDERTWEHHLRAADYSRWFRDEIGDDELADEVAAVEGDDTLAAEETRKRVLDSVRSRYTAPASA